MKNILTVCASLFLSSRSSGAFTLLPKSLAIKKEAILLSTSLAAKKDKKKKNSGRKPSTSGLKGFGSTTTSAASVTGDVPIDRSKSALNFYSFINSQGAGASLKRVALGFFPFNEGDKECSLRGVVALKTIKKGDVIIEIPFEAAWNLGMESSDPTLPGTMVLQEYCRWISGAKVTGKRDLGPYLEMLPEFRSKDVLGSTDFFSDDALEMLQLPQIKEETLSRKEKTQARFDRDVAPMIEIAKDMYKWKGGEGVTEEHLRWAVWLVTSRVLTVQGEAGTNDNFRLMIPLIDMCNHDRTSPHVLTGRAVPGGKLKVVAGKTVQAGEQINIVYGGGVSGNDRFIQDYGFLDNFCNGQADDITAKILMGRARIVEGSGARNGRPTLMPVDERERALASLDASSLEEDMSVLASSGDILDSDKKTALEFRIGVKKALKKLGYGLAIAS